MDDKERAERIKLVKTTGVAIAVVLTVLSACLIFLSMSVSQPGETRFTLLIISAVAGILAAVSVMMTFWRIEKIKSRKSLIIGSACIMVSVAAMLTLALVSLLN